MTTNETKRMKHIFFFLSVIGILFLNSCASFKKGTFSENQVYLTEKNLELINGTYKHNDSERPSPLDYFWGSFYKMKEYKSVYELASKHKEPYFITLKVIDKKKINVEVKVKDSILKTYHIRGKVKNGYFEQNRKMYLIPAILYNAYHSSKFRIGYLNNKSVVTNFKKIEFGTFYFFSPFNVSEEVNNLTAKRIE